MNTTEDCVRWNLTLIVKLDRGVEFWEVFLLICTRYELARTVYHLRVTNRRLSMTYHHFGSPLLLVSETKAVYKRSTNDVFAFSDEDSGTPTVDSKTVRGDDGKSKLWRCGKSETGVSSEGDTKMETVNWMT